MKISSGRLWCKRLCAPVRPAGPIGLLATAGVILGVAGCGGSSHSHSHSHSAIHQPAKRTRQVFALRNAAPIGHISAASPTTSGRSGHGVIARYVSFPVLGINRAHALSESAKGRTVPLWNGTATALGHTYDYVMVGASPFGAPATSNVSVDVDVVPVELQFLDASGNAAYTFDPGVPNPDCGETASPTQLLLQSPLFQTSSYTVGGINVGNVQYESAFLREEFAKQVLGQSAPNPNYGITLNATSQPEITITVPSGAWQVAPASDTGACGGSSGGDLGLISVSSWDSYLQQTVIGQLQSSGETSSRHLLELLLSNVMLVDGNSCCIAGYHSGVSTREGVQYYASSLYGPPGLSHGGAIDIGPASHELGEWLNDPNGQNTTPAWGHIGQVASCSATLEVGDPLTGSSVPVTMPNGVTYHPQELAFASWFYHDRSSPGINGWFSSNGTFRSAPPLCAGAVQ